MKNFFKKNTNCRIKKIAPKINKLSLPVTILIVGIIMSGSIYASQLSKQKSIEKQQQNDRQQQENKDDLKIKQSECNTLSNGVKEKWNNVIGVTYSELWKECVVTYIDEKMGGIIRTLPLNDIKTDTKNLPQKDLPQEPLSQEQMNIAKSFSDNQKNDYNQLRTNGVSIQEAFSIVAGEVNTDNPQ